ncbi:alpha-beta hydrolase superfamily lysophospholipase [Labedella gwakjiensis]|uniref:Alpha-beta hydrolase superfamily lysophospholipase n=1 Tax=Labedella gwakjiensis TaxID=390269 RepID=A0A2P8GW73_9MICO|nr:alpha/beta hydrolase [Labedella gwakjiensis]PSL38205.1 alpha-beta hydrolase superfamily lysophospholipase [Labedella gwakjiensis]RUQ87253.1 alpha/beta hydrolase [Labedella gwakjiensis]
MSQAPETRTLVDADGVTIWYYAWAAEQPRGIVHIAHGAGEHAGRYQQLADDLVGAGFTVVADDHRGHGATGENHLGLGRLGQGTTRGAIRSVLHVGQTIAEQNPGVPLVLLGHSWGSLMAQKIVAGEHPYDAVVLSGSSLAIPGVINAGDLNKRWRGAGSTGFEWLSRDPAVGTAFAEDPRAFDIAERPVWTAVQAFAFLGRPLKGMRDIPVLIQGGSDDSLGGTRGMTLLRDAYVKRSKLSDVTMRIYEGARHEIYKETNRDEIVGDLLAWLDARVPR